MQIFCKGCCCVPKNIGSFVWTLTHVGNPRKQPNFLIFVYVKLWGMDLSTVIRFEIKMYWESKVICSAKQPKGWATSLNIFILNLQTEFHFSKTKFGVNLWSFCCLYVEKIHVLSKWTSHSNFEFWMHAGNHWNFPPQFLNHMRSKMG